MKQLPLGTQTFGIIREEDQLSVDKTKYVYDLTHSFRHVFLSRPRRFGKSLLCDTFKMYFEGRKDIFQGLAIMDLEKDWKKYQVIHLDLSIRKDSAERLRKSLGVLLTDYEQIYDIPVCNSREASDRLSSTRLSASTSWTRRRKKSFPSIRWRNCNPKKIPKSNPFFQNFFLPLPIEHIQTINRYKLWQLNSNMLLCFR